MSARNTAEDSLRKLEREKALLQHQNTESLRKADIETERKRSLENEGEKGFNQHTDLLVLTII